MILALFSGLLDIGGVQMAARQTAAALTKIGEKRDWPCVFLSLNDEPGDHYLCAADTQFSFRGFHRRKAEFMIQALRLARDKPRLIFAGHPNLAPTALAMKAIARNSRTIVGAHGIEIWQPLSLVRRSALRRADLVMVPSAYTLEKASLAQGVPANRILKIPWPLDSGFLALSESAPALSAPPGFPRGMVVLSVGRWSSAERYKGADILIRAVAQLSSSFAELQLVLAGPGDDIGRLKKEAQDSGIAQRVHFFPSVSRRELAAFYSRSELFALPSTGEGFGLVLLEAMAFGKAVIAANAGGIPDVVRHEREGLLVVPSVEALSAGLRRLLSDPVLRTELGMRGQERVQTEFSFSRFQENLSSAIDLLPAQKQQLGKTATT